MSELTEIKHKGLHYHRDDQGRLQGEFKSWWTSTRKLRQHRIFKDGDRHGEDKGWDQDGKQCTHFFYQDDVEITDQVKAVVEDIDNITKEERMLIKLKFGIECLP